MEILDTLQEEIAASHSKALARVDDARDGVTAAIDASLYTAALIEKASKIKRHDLLEFLSPIMNGADVKRYMSIQRVATKRDFIDKRQMQLIGIIDMQEPLEGDAKPVAVKSMGTILGRFKLEIDKKLKARPVNDWTSAEAEQFKMFLAPYQAILSDLDD